MARCVIYARISSRSQCWGHGIVRQIETCQHRARSDKSWVVGVYVDIASGSGGPLPQRELAIKHASQLGCPIYIEAIDRWTRSAADPTLSDDSVKLRQCASFALECEHKLRSILETVLASK